MIDTERERERERDRRREKQAPCKEPNVGLDPRTPGSRPGPKAGAKPLRHQGCPTMLFLKNILFIHERERGREGGREGGRERETQRNRQREKQTSCREPDVGLDPRTPGSRPGPKAGAKPLSHPGIPTTADFKQVLCTLFRISAING